MPENLTALEYLTKCGELSDRVRVVAIHILKQFPEGLPSIES